MDLFKAIFENSESEASSSESENDETIVVNEAPVTGASTALVQSVLASPVVTLAPVPDAAAVNSFTAATVNEKNSTEHVSVYAASVSSVISPTTGFLCVIFRSQLFLPRGCAHCNENA